LSAGFRLTTLADNKISVHPAGFKNKDELENAIKIFKRDRVQIVFVADTPLIYIYREALIRLAGRRFPISAHVKDYAKMGALFTYAPDMQEMLKRTSVHVDKILKGEKAGDIPIERAFNFELTLNLKTAKAFDLVIPESILLRTNETIR
jgi:putative ABC transport system substrate-binding protein